MRPERRVHYEAHNDGANAWAAARASPAPELAGEIYGYSDYWERTANLDTRRETPHAEGVLIFNLGPPIEIIAGDGRALTVATGGAFVAGVHLRPAFSRSCGTQAGVHVYLPLSTLRRVLRVPMGEIVDQVAPLNAFLGAEAHELGARLCEAPDTQARVDRIEAALGQRLAAAPPPCARLMRALTRIRKRPDLDIAEIAREVGWSRKHLAARIEDAVGVGPRSFRRLLRFQKLTALIKRFSGPPDWARLAQDAGYFDQSHMIREFHEFAGMTPSTYRARMMPDGGGLVEA